MTTPNYVDMSGAEFQREVGADPEKWASAFCERELPLMAKTGIEKILAAYFQDAMNAAIARDGYPKE